MMCLTKTVISSPPRKTRLLNSIKKVGLTICEDIWNDEDFWPERRYRHNPPVELAEAGAEIIFNISASPWHLGKNQTR